MAESPTGPRGSFVWTMPAFSLTGCGLLRRGFALGAAYHCGFHAGEDGFGDSLVARWVPARFSNLSETRSAEMPSLKVPEFGCRGDQSGVGHDARVSARTEREPEQGAAAIAWIPAMAMKTNDSARRAKGATTRNRRMPRIIRIKTIMRYPHANASLRSQRGGHF